MRDAEFREFCSTPSECDDFDNEDEEYGEEGDGQCVWLGRVVRINEKSRKLSTYIVSPCGIETRRSEGF